MLIFSLMICLYNPNFGTCITLISHKITKMQYRWSKEFQRLIRFIGVQTNKKLLSIFTFYADEISSVSICFCSLFCCGCMFAKHFQLGFFIHRTYIWKGYIQLPCFTESTQKLTEITNKVTEITSLYVHLHVHAF
jgi:hypothetical protein